MAYIIRQSPLKLRKKDFMRTHAERLEALIAPASEGSALPTAVVHPCDKVALEGALLARERNLIVPTLVGPERRIRAVAETHGLDLHDCVLIDAPHSHASAEHAVALVREGLAAALMKGSLHTDELMGAILDRSHGLRTEHRLSHVFYMDVPLYSKPLILTDAAINIEPTLEEKVHIVQNAIDFAVAMGIAEPHVALLAAVETVNPKMRATLDAAVLCKMADRGQIRGGVLDGPLAFDNAISAEAAARKRIVSPVSGRVDILVAPDIESANMLAKQLEYLADAITAGLVLGARVPVILTSRADSAETRLASAAVAVRYANMRGK
jgi:phosphate acetyltransferase